MLTRVLRCSSILTKYITYQRHILLHGRQVKELSGLLVLLSTVGLGKVHIFSRLQMRLSLIEFIYITICNGIIQLLLHETNAFERWSGINHQKSSGSVAATMQSDKTFIL